MKFKRLIAIAPVIFAAALATAARAQTSAYQPIPNFKGIGAGQQLLNALNNNFSGKAPISPAIVSVMYENLPPEEDGRLFYCKNCSKTVPCATGGPGAFAFGQGGAWACANGTAISGGHLNDLSPATGNYNLNNNKIVNYLAGSANGDALVFGLNHQTDLSGAITSFGSVGSGTQTCPNTATACSVTLTSNSGVTLSAAAPANTANIQYLTWQVKQDSAGGRVPTWNLTRFRFAGGTAPTPSFSPNATEQFLFEWNPALALWDFVGRGGVQQHPQTSQGGGAGIGPGNGNVGNTYAPFPLPANTWTQVISDNGGFLTAQGGGVALYNYMVVGMYTVCNYNSSTEFFASNCTVGGFPQPASPMRQIGSNECKNVVVFPSVANVAGNSFSAFFCYVNPTSALVEVFHNYYTQEIPVQ